jgi:antitoxin ParD1/3/4
MPSSYTIGAHFEGFVRGMVESGRYNNASEVLRDGLRLLEEREILRGTTVAELRRLVEEGRLSGPTGEPGDVTLDRLEAKIRAFAAQRSNGA